MTAFNDLLNLPLYQNALTSADAITTFMASAVFPTLAVFPTPAVVPTLPWLAHVLLFACST